METSVAAEPHPSLQDLYEQQNKHLCNSLSLITNIFEDALFSSVDNTISDMFENLTNLESRTKALFQACISTQFFPHIHKLWMLLNTKILKQGVNPDTGTVDVEAFEKFRQGLAFAQLSLLSKKYIVEWAKTYKMALIYWIKLQAIHKFDFLHKHTFEHQMIALLVRLIFSLLHCKRAQAI